MGTMTWLEARTMTWLEARAGLLMEGLEKITLYSKRVFLLMEGLSHTAPALKLISMMH